MVLWHNSSQLSTPSFLVFHFTHKVSFYLNVPCFIQPLTPGITFAYNASYRLRYKPVLNQNSKEIRRRGK